MSCFATLLKRLISLLQTYTKHSDKPIPAMKQKRNPFFQVLSKKEGTTQSKCGVTKKYNKSWETCLKNFPEFLFFPHSLTMGGVGAGVRREHLPQHSLNIEALRENINRSLMKYLCTIFQLRILLSSIILLL